MFELFSILYIYITYYINGVLMSGILNVQILLRKYKAQMQTTYMYV